MLTFQIYCFLSCRRCIPPPLNIWFPPKKEAFKRNQPLFFLPSFFLPPSPSFLLASHPHTYLSFVLCVLLLFSLPPLGSTAHSSCFLFIGQTASSFLSFPSSTLHPDPTLPFCFTHSFVCCACATFSHQNQTHVNIAPLSLCPSFCTMPFTDVCVASVKRIPRKPVKMSIDVPSVFDRSPLSPSSPISPGLLVDDASFQVPPGLFDITGAYNPEITWEINSALIASAARFQDAEEDEEVITTDDDDDDEIIVERIFGQSLQRSRRQANLATVASPRTSTSSSSSSTPSTPALSRCDSNSSMSSLEHSDDLVSITRSLSISSLDSVHQKDQHVRSSEWNDHSSVSPDGYSSAELRADSFKEEAAQQVSVELNQVSQTAEKPKRSFGLLRFGSGRPSSSSSIKDSSPEVSNPCRSVSKSSLDCPPSPSASTSSSYFTQPPPALASISSAHALFSTSLPLIHTPTGQSSTDGISSSSTSPALSPSTKETKLKAKTQTFSYIQRRSSPSSASSFGLKELRELRLAAEVLQLAARSRVESPKEVNSGRGKVQRKAVPVFVLDSEDNEAEAEAEARIERTAETVTRSPIPDPAIPMYFHLPKAKAPKWSSVPATSNVAMPPMAIARPKRGFLGQSNKSMRTSVAFTPGYMKTGKGIYLGVDGCDEGLQSIQY